MCSSEGAGVGRRHLGESCADGLRKRSIGLGAESVMTEGGKSHCGGEQGQRVHMKAGLGERLIMVMWLGGGLTLLSLGWDSENMGGSGCSSVLSYWYWQVLKQQVSAPTSQPPP